MLMEIQLNSFEFKVYLKIGGMEKIEPNQGYTIYLGEINLDKFENSVRTMIKRVVFKTKGNEYVK